MNNRSINVVKEATKPDDSMSSLNLKDNLWPSEDCHPLTFEKGTQTGPTCSCNCMEPVYAMLNKILNEMKKTN